MLIARWSSRPGAWRSIAPPRSCSATRTSIACSSAARASRPRPQLISSQSKGVTMADKLIDARGRQLGGETPLICTPLVGRSRERVLAEAASVVPKKPDVIEWRVDFFDAIGDTATVLDVARALRTAAGELPIIFTRRSIKE